MKTKIVNFEYIESRWLGITRAMRSDIKELEFEIEQIEVFHPANSIIEYYNVIYRNPKTNNLLLVVYNSYSGQQETTHEEQQIKYINRYFMKKSLKEVIDNRV